MRRDFFLPDEDEEFLDSSSYDWDTIKDLNTQWLLIHDFEVPEGYNVRSASIAFLIPSMYPDAPLDMFFTNPVLSIRGKSIRQAAVIQKIAGIDYQRWSRHREQGSWKPGVDGIPSQVLLAKESLKREVAQNDEEN